MSKTVNATMRILAGSIPQDMRPDVDRAYAEGLAEYGPATPSMDGCRALAFVGKGFAFRIGYVKKPDKVNIDPFFRSRITAKYGGTCAVVKDLVDGNTAINDGQIVKWKERQTRKAKAKVTTAANAATPNVTTPAKPKRKRKAKPTTTPTTAAAPQPTTNATNDTAADVQGLSPDEQVSNDTNGQA